MQLNHNISIHVLLSDFESHLYNWQERETHDIVKSMDIPNLHTKTINTCNNDKKSIAS